MIRTIYLAGGCFWGVEKYFSLLRGVVGTRVGYANGRTENPTYAEICKDDTGHAETVEVRYDEEAVSLSFLLDRYFEVIDPTSLNRQGPDVGTQYRTGVYYLDEADAPVVEASLSALGRALSLPVCVEALPLRCFYPAEESHQKYLEKNPGGYCHIGQAAFDRVKGLAAEK